MARSAAQAEDLSTPLRRQVEHLLQHLAADPASPQSAFALRALRAVQRLADTLSRGSLGTAVAAETDIEVLVQALQDPALLTGIENPLAKARARGLLAQRQLVRAEGGALSAQQVGEILGISRQAVNKRRQAGNLLALPAGRRGFIYPVWQFQDGAVLDGLEEALAILEEHDPWMQLRFFLSPSIRLDDERPLDLLRRGERGPVLEAAHAYGEHGSD